MIKVEIDDRQVRDALERLQRAGADLKPAMQEIGEYLVESTRKRFQHGVAPDGTPWAPNRESTYLGYLDKFGGSYGKDGRLSRKGAGRAAGKKPLIGETRQLSTKIFPRATAHSVEVGSPLEYAATHQFGARARSFSGGKTPWGDIPARPFLGLSEADRAAVLDILADHLDRALGKK